MGEGFVTQDKEGEQSFIKILMELHKKEEELGLWDNTTENRGKPLTQNAEILASKAIIRMYKRHRSYDEL